MEASRRVNAQEFNARRVESNEFKGLGYSSTIANYISHRFKDDTKTAPPKPEKLGRAATKLAVPVLQDERRTSGGSDAYLAISSLSRGGGGIDSLYVDDETYAIVDSGTTVTITNLKDKTMPESKLVVY